MDGHLKPFSKAVARPPPRLFPFGSETSADAYCPEVPESALEGADRGVYRDRRIAELEAENLALRRALASLQQIGFGVLAELNRPRAVSSEKAAAPVGDRPPPSLSPMHVPNSSPILGFGVPPILPLASAPTAPESTSSTFVFSLRKVDGGELGIDVLEEPSPQGLGQVLRVEAVLAGGAIEAWNRQLLAGGTSPQSAERCVRPGDRILKVNDVSGDANLMLIECRDRQLLKITVARGGLCGEQSQATAPKGRASTPPPTKWPEIADRVQRTPERTPERPSKEGAGHTSFAPTVQVLGDGKAKFFTSI